MILIKSDGRTVWIHQQGEMIARFGIYGIDIHSTMGNQTEESHCLYCTHTKTILADWNIFVEKVKEIYSIEIDPKYKPDRFR